MGGEGQGDDHQRGSGGAASGSPRGSSPSSPPRPSGIPAAGDVIAARYQVEQVLGAGGMGVVVAARHMHLGLPVAIKFMRGDAALDVASKGRFLQEARALVVLTSEHATKVFDAGILDDGAPYMVMERLVGVELAEQLRQHGPASVPEAVGIVLEASEAVAEAHANGIVHRDLKPSNLFITRRVDRTTLVKVLDFGISKMSSLHAPASQQDLTGSGQVMGSPLYMSPEQVRSARNVDARTDVWALGTILYELLAGVTPFVGATLGETFAHILQDPPEPIRRRKPEVPEALDQLVLHCLAKDPNQRVPSVQALALRLAPFAPPSAKVSLDRIRSLAGGAEGAARVGHATLEAPSLSGAAWPSFPSASGSHGTVDPWQTPRASAAPRTAHPRAVARPFIFVVAALLVVSLGAGALWRGSKGPATPGSAASGGPSSAEVPAVAPPTVAPAALPAPVVLAPHAPAMAPEAPPASAPDAGAPPAPHPSAPPKPASKLDAPLPKPQKPATTTNEKDIF